jgi:hypothetical protein
MRQLEMVPTSMAHRFLPLIEACSRAASAVNCHDERARRSNLKRADRDDTGVCGVALSRCLRHRESQPWLGRLIA